MQLSQAVDFVSNFFPAAQNLHEGLACVFWSWYLPVGQGVQVKVSVSVPTKQLRSPDPWKPAEQDGVQVEPDARVAGQLPVVPLVGALLAFGQGML